MFASMIPDKMKLVEGLFHAAAVSFQETSPVVGDPSNIVLNTSQVTFKLGDQ